MGYTLKYKTAKDLQKKVDEYFQKCDDNEKPYTKSGLQLHLGFSNHNSFKDNAKRGQDFAEIFDFANLRIMDQYESLLASGKPIGSIFWLKCQGNYVEAGQNQENQDINITLKMSGNDERPSIKAEDIENKQLNENQTNSGNLNNNYDDTKEL